MELIEKICRVICEAEQVDPDRESKGLGNLIPLGQNYKLWEARIRIAELLIEKGLIYDNKC